MKKKVAAVLVALALVAPVGVASAHNAGHVILPSGECLNVGGQNSVKVPEQNPHRNDNGELDLDPSTPDKDEFGARYAADQGKSKVLPKPCP